MDIAVIGTSVLYPGSTDAQGFWRDILNGKDLITEVPPEQWLSEDYYQPDPAAEDKTYANRGGFLTSIPFDPMEFAIPPADLKAIDMSQLLALVVAKRLLSELKNPISDGLSDRTSVILGMSSTTELILELNSRLQRPIWRKVMEASGLPSDVVEQVQARGASMYTPWREASFPGFLGNVAAGRIANRFDLGGTNLIVDAACASSLAAFHMALLELEAHRADLVVTGGVSTMAEALMYVAFSKTHGLSRSNDCRPFSDQADGTLLGEGIGMFALKRTADAERDGDPVFAVIRGIGSSSDGGGTAIYAPKIEGQQKALKRAYQDAGVDPSTVELIEAHGTGTVAGDAVEYAALASTFAAGQSKMDRRWCALGSIKSQIGHTKAAAGSAGLFKAIMALHHHVLPPTIKISAPNPRLREALSPFYLNTEMRPWLKSQDHPRRAGVSAFGFGGTNFHVVLEEYRGNQPRPPKIRSMESEWLAFSADDQGELILSLRQALDQSSEIPLDQLAYTWQRRFRAQHRLRLTVVSASPEAFAKTAEHLLDLLDSSRALDDIGWPKGVYFGQGAPSGKMALLFPGQGSQYLNMGRQVSSAFDEMQDVLGRMNASVKSDIPLIDVLYPHSLWTTADRQAATERLADTRWSQRSIGALSAGYVALLRKIGIKPDAVAGHSFGELSALYAANALDETTYSALADVRGRLMAEAAATAKGGMTAVFASAETVQTVINEHQLQVTFSADNAPQQVVVAGPIPDLGQAEAIFKQKGLRFHRLPVGTAFHTSQVEPAVKPFREALATMPIEVPQCPVYSCVSGSSHRADPESIKDLLAQQMVSPVQFRQIVQAMYADGVRIFVEVGPRNTLTKLVEGILSDPAVRAIAVDQFDMNGITALWHAFAQLSAAGIPIDVERLWESHPPKASMSSRKPSPATVWINGSNHGKPYPQALKKLAPLNQAIPAAVPEDEKAKLGDWQVPNPRGKAEVTQVVDQFTQALAAYQTLLHDSHAAFLDLAEATTQALAGGGDPVSSGPKSEPSETVAKPQEPMIMLPPTKGPRLRPGIAVAQAQTILTGMGRAPVEADADVALHREGSMPSGAGVSAWAQVVAVVAEKTGYPAELLEPGQALEEDLGIDSLKRVEILSALESRLPGLSRQISTARTLGDLAGREVAPVVTEADVALHREGEIPSGAGVSAWAQVVAVVAEKTGYPAELLEPGQALEEDLGIDSLKRVEILSALESRLPGLSRQISTARTLGDLAGREVAPVVTEADVALHREGAIPSGTEASAWAQVVAVVAEKTGYPAELLEPGQALEEDLGIDSLKRVEILSALESRLPGLSRQISTARTLGDLAGRAPVVAEADVALHRQGSMPSGTEVSAWAQVVAVVAEKTGYPAELLEPSQALEEDLGIDSLKRVEILSALESRLPGLSRQISTARTLGDLAGRAPVVTEADPALHREGSMPSGTEASAWAQVVAVVAEKTGYPAELLEPGQALEEDLGIDSLKRVEILSALESRLPGLSRQISTVRTLGDLVPAGEDLPMSNVSTPSSIDSWEDALDGQVLKSWQVCTHAREASGFGLLSSEFPYPVYLVGGPLTVRESLMASLPGIEVRWVDAADRLPAEARAVVFLAGLNAFHSETEAIAVNRIAFGLARSLVQHHPDALLVTVQRTGGDFGQTGNGDLGVWAAGMTGLVRTLSKEFSQATVKAIDVGPNYTDAEAGALVGHELTQGGLEIEVGYSADRTRIVPVLEEHTMEGTEAPLVSGSVILATGGARGVTAAILKAMARERPVKIGILGRTPIEPQTQLPLFDKEAALAWLVQQAKAQGIKYTPQELSRRAQALLAAQEGNQTLDELRALGAEVLYLACDVRDENEVLRAIEAVRQRFGPITAVLHGAGVLRDRRLEDKTDQDFADVFDTKVVGLLALLAHTASDPLTHIAVISSIAASIGNVGQSDYAMANEVLNKVAAREQRLRGDQVAVVAWGLGPWDGGMVDSTIGQYFAEQRIRLIAPESGAKFCVESWQRHLPSTQWVMAMAPKNMRHPRDPRRKQGERRGYWRIQADHFAYLQGHTIGQTVVVPFTVAIGVMVEAARAFHPTASMVQIHDVALLHGILAEKFYQDGDVVEIVAKVIEAGGGGADLEQREVEVVLRDVRQRPLYRGVVVLGHHLSTQADLGLGESGEIHGAWPYPLDTVYADKMFHKGAFQVIRQLEQFSERGVSALLEAEQAPWPHQGEPLIWDGGLQLLGLWGHEFLHQRALPTHVKTMHLYRPLQPGETVRCTVWGRKPTSAKLVADIYWSTLKGERVAMMRSAEMHGLGPDTGGWHSPPNEPLT